MVLTRTRERNGCTLAEVLASACFLMEAVSSGMPDSRTPDKWRDWEADTAVLSTEPCSGWRPD